MNLYIGSDIIVSFWNIYGVYVCVYKSMSVVLFLCPILCLLLLSFRISDCKIRVLLPQYSGIDNKWRNRIFLFDWLKLDCVLMYVYYVYVLPRWIFGFINETVYAIHLIFFFLIFIIYFIWILFQSQIANNIGKLLWMLTSIDTLRLK